MNFVPVYQTFDTCKPQCYNGQFDIGVELMTYTIVYIEDETAIIELVDVVLEHPEVKLISVLNGEEGLKTTREVKPDVVLLDVMMPDRSGWSIYSEIRNDTILQNTPIVMLTGQVHKYRIKKEFDRSTIDAYVTKPFDVMSVRRAIEKVLHKTLWETPTQLLSSQRRSASRRKAQL
jgi:CheY-like chemotaxis protein